jgi:hypothetical protein
MTQTHRNNRWIRMRFRKVEQVWIRIRIYEIIIDFLL